MATHDELDALRKSGETKNFQAEWAPAGGVSRNEGCRGTVERVGFPADAHAVHVRDTAGNLHRWDMRHLTVL